MNVHLTEDEQLESLKRWWDENGRSTLIGVVLAVALVFGWQGWQSQQQKKREAASVLYEDLLEVVSVPQGETLSEEQVTTAFSLADELKNDYSGLYASNAALFAAKLAVEQGDLDKAEAELRWVLDENGGEPMELVARQRLAQVLYAREEYDEALSTLDAVEPGSFAAGFSELRGDILVARNQLDEARNAYQLALSNLLSGQGERRNIVQMKLNDISAVAVGGDADEGSGGAIDPEADAGGQAEPGAAGEPDTAATDAAEANS